MKAHRVNEQHVAIFCPGCKTAHAIDSRWTFNGDFERPTFSPSLHVKWGDPSWSNASACHSFITNGRIQFLGDCTHELAGQTVDLPDWHGMDPDKYE